MHRADFGSTSKFDHILSDPENVYWFQLKPGKMLRTSWVFGGISANEPLLIKDVEQSSTTGVYCTADPRSPASDACAAGTVRLPDPYTLILRLKLTSLFSSQPRRLHLQVPHDELYERADRRINRDWLSWQTSHPITPNTNAPKDAFKQTCSCVQQFRSAANPTDRFLSI